MADTRKTGQNDWRDQPPEENDSQREDGSQAQDVAEDALRMRREGGVASVPDAKHYPKEWRPEDDPLSGDAADSSTDAVEAEGHPS